MICFLNPRYPYCFCFFDKTADIAMCPRDWFPAAHGLEPGSNLYHVNQFAKFLRHPSTFPRCTKDMLAAIFLVATKKCICLHGVLISIHLKSDSFAKSAFLVSMSNFQAITSQKLTYPLKTKGLEDEISLKMAPFQGRCQISRVLDTGWDPLKWIQGF